jgi:hypothetical protein
MTWWICLLILIFILVIASYLWLCSRPQNSSYSGGDAKEIKTIRIPSSDICFIEQGLKNHIWWPAKKSGGKKIKAQVIEIDDYPTIEDAIYKVGYKNLYPSAANFMEALSMAKRDVPEKDGKTIKIAKIRI